MTHYTEFGAEARKIMFPKNIKMKDVANELGVSVTYVSEIFKGTRPGKVQKPAIAKMPDMDCEVAK